MNEATSTRIDPTLKGLICCLIGLEEEAVASGHILAANLIAAAYLSLGETQLNAADDGRELTNTSFVRRLNIVVNECERVAGG